MTGQTAADTLEGKLSRVRLLALDVDGVLTDGMLMYGPQGEELKTFHVHDGLGISLARQSGLPSAIITGRNSEIITKRARELRIEHVLMGVRDKGAALRKLAEELHLDLSEICFVADDLNDLPALHLAGVAIAVADAAPEVKVVADYITARSGGCGAVREAVEVILRAQGRWEQAVSTFVANLEADGQ